MSFEPIVLGLAGGAATGKTVTAERFAPITNRFIVNDGSPIFWSHLYFAMPIHKMASIRQKIRGDEAFDRQCFELHETLNDLFKGYISYEETVDTVFELASMECPLEGKPRSFLQKAGTEICRSFDPECFIKWVDRKIREEHERFKHNLDSLAADSFKSISKSFGVVLSDTRFFNECEYVKNQPRGLLIKFTARPEVVRERIYNRDGVTLTPEQMAHASEQDLNDVPDEMFDLILDTSDLSIAEQYETVKQVVEEKNYS